MGSECESVNKELTPQGLNSAVVAKDDKLGVSAPGGSTIRRQQSQQSATSVNSAGEPKMSSRSVVWRRRRVPPQLPFSLTRCRLCKRAKQGAVFCRVVRRHNEDGWQAPDGFDVWLENWEKSNAPLENNDEENEDHNGNLSGIEHPVTSPRPRQSSSVRRTSSRAAAVSATATSTMPVSGTGTQRRNTMNSLSRSLETRNATLPILSGESQLTDRSIAVWRPCDTVDCDHFLRTIQSVREEDALQALYKHDYDQQTALSALESDESVQVRRYASLEEDEEKKRQAMATHNVGSGILNTTCPLRAASETFLATAAWIAEVSEIEAKEEGHPGFCPPPNIVKFSEEDLAKFADTLLDCDRDCRMALKKLNKVSAFTDATMAEVLELYYARLKPAPRYEDWKQRLNKRRHSLGGDEDEAAEVSDTYFLGGYEPADPDADDVFDCPCGCGRTVDNRGRAASHKRKWATRGCRDRAARAVLGNCSNNSIHQDDITTIPRYQATPRQPTSKSSVTNSEVKARVSSKPPPRAPSRVSPRQQPSQASTTATAATTTITASQPDPPSPLYRSSPSTSSGKQRLALVHSGILLALPKKDDAFIAAQVRCRGPEAETWFVQTIHPDASFGDEHTMSTIEIVDAMLNQDFAALASTAGNPNEPPRYRGVTCKKYGEASRYNAAFSLLGDRFSLGGFDLAEQAAAAWDVVAWRSGRDDLNLLKLPKCTIQPSRDDLKRLARQLRDNMRLRSFNSNHLARLTTLDLDAIDLATRKLALVLATTKKEDLHLSPSQPGNEDEEKLQDFSLSAPAVTTKMEIDDEAKEDIEREKQEKTPSVAVDTNINIHKDEVLTSPAVPPQTPIRENTSILPKVVPTKKKIVQTPPMSIEHVASESRQEVAAPKPSIGDALFGPCFKTDTGAALILHDVVYLVSVRLSRRWLVERYDSDAEIAADNTVRTESPPPPPLLEMSAADVQRAGQKSFALLSRGILTPSISQATSASVIRFLTAELIGRHLLDADKKLKPQQRERCIARLKIRSDIGTIVADTAPLNANRPLASSLAPASPISNSTPRRLVDTPNGADATSSFWKNNISVEYELEAVRKAIERFDSQSNSQPPRKKMKTPPATPSSASARAGNAGTPNRGGGAASVSAWAGGSAAD